MATEKPIGVAIVICEKVITEVGSMNKTLVSTFNSVKSQSFPCVMNLSVYVALTNSAGEKQVNLVFAQGDKKLVNMGGKVNFSNPNQIAELIFNVKALPLTEPGMYSFEVMADGEFVFESRFNAIKL